MTYYGKGTPVDLERLTRKRDWERQAARRTPKRWANELRRIGSRRTRLVVAQIVWWDWFSRRRGTATWPHLDHYVRAWDPQYPLEVPVEKILAALMQLGYPADVARDRIGAGEE
jgi:hypothetical protein